VLHGFSLLSEGLSSCPLSGSLGKEANLTFLKKKIKKACRLSEEIPADFEYLRYKSCSIIVLSYL